MRSLTLLLILFFLSSYASAQDDGFPFGKVTYSDLELRNYPKDTSAVALVLNEFGEAYIENGDDYNLIFKNHVKIKILKKAGLEYADFEIPLRKIEAKAERIRSVTASTFNVENGSMREVKFDTRKQFTENKNKYWDIVKFALPNVRVGSVIEVEYVLESPFIMKFRSWEFQSDIPKIQSEYRASIPGIYKYNISLRGFLPLTKNENSIVTKCFTIGSASADCLEIKCAMKDVPAFIEEDYMTARSNYLSAINFELAEIDNIDGSKDKIAQEWKDAEDELRRDPKFGLQLRRGGDIVDTKVGELIAGDVDPILKARKIYDFIKGWYRWNEVYGEYSEFGIKKSFESKVGNVGDINLSLIAALKYAGLNVEPLLLSTRENGLVSELYPVLSDFNYVIAKLNINEKVYLLDATEVYLCFGLVPERCLNGKGRVLGDKESYWYELKAPEKQKVMSVQKLKIESSGAVRGSIQNTYYGYEAMNQRKRLNNYSSEKEYVANLSNRLAGSLITNYKLENAADYLKPLIVTLEVEMGGESGMESAQLFNPFVFERWERNPFKSTERLYPVDFGVPLEEIVTLQLEYPAGYEVEDLPEKVGLALPEGGGRYIFSIQNASNLVTMYSSLLINKAVYTSQEYHYLKELFGRVVATQQTDLVIKKKQ